MPLTSPSEDGAASAAEGMRGRSENLPHVSVIIPTRNRAALLRRLLDALAEQDYPRFDIVVVDDASTDGTPQILADWQGAGRTPLRQETPAGSYAARNRGWRAASGEIMAFTDDDCRPHPGWLWAMAAAFDEGRDDAPPGRKRPVVGAQGVILAQPGLPTPFTHQLEQTRAGPPYRTANVAYRRLVLEQLGGFDDSLRWYADNIFGLRARRLGEIRFVPTAVVYHPPRPRQWRTRADWRDRFAADARYRQALRALGAERLSPSGRLLPIVLWIARPLIKQSAAHLSYFRRHPRLYLTGLPPMLREKWELAKALWDDLSAGKDAPTALRNISSLDTSSDTDAGAAEDAPLVSVIVVTRGRTTLADTLDALRRQTYARKDIIVVDHAASEATRQTAGRAGAAYASAAGATLGGARQVGVDVAQGDIVAFTDDDCLPALDWIEKLVEAFARHPEWRGAQGATQAEAGPIGTYAIRVARPDPLYRTCNIAYRRESLHAAGGFDPGFRGWFEDTDLGARVAQHGPIGFAADAVVVHRAMPRRFLTRGEWTSLIADERRLAEGQPEFYRRTRGPAVLTTILARWLLGSMVKTLGRDAPRAWRDPAGYLRLLWGLLRERLALLQALQSGDKSRDSTHFSRHRHRADRLRGRKRREP